MDASRLARGMRPASKRAQTRKIATTRLTFDAIIPLCDDNLAKALKARLALESAVCAKYVRKSSEMVPVRSHTED